MSFQNLFLNFIQELDGWMDLAFSHLLNIYQQFICSGHCAGSWSYNSDQDTVSALRELAVL